MVTVLLDVAPAAAPGATGVERSFEIIMAFYVGQ